MVYNTYNWEISITRGILGYHMVIIYYEVGSTAALGEKPHLDNAEAHKGLTIAAPRQQGRQHLRTTQTQASFRNVPDEKWEVHWKNAVLIGTN